MANYNEADDFEWQPPSEAEMKVIQARRERSDKISKIMGDYLLKGYKMLGTCCSQCTTILLQDKQGREYCVACSELDCDANKDDPVLSSEAAQRQVQEQNERSLTESALSDDHYMPTAPPDTDNRGQPSAPRTTDNTMPSAEQCVPAVHTDLGASGSSNMSLTRSKTSQVAIPPTSVGYAVDISSSQSFSVAEPIQAVQGKLQWACNELQQTSSVDYSIQLCQLIKGCADTISALQAAHNNNTGTPS